MVGLGAQFCTLLEVWVLEVGMSTFDAQTSLYTEDQGIQVPMALEHGSIVGTQCCDNTVPSLVRPDPRVRQRILPSRYVQIYWNGPHCVSRVANKTNKPYTRQTQPLSLPYAVSSSDIVEVGSGSF